MTNKIGTYFKLVNSFIVKIVDFIRNQYNSFIQDIKKTHYNFKNFALTNTELALYHINKQNYNDAIFRLKLVDKFSKPNDPFINYWLGWCYLLKGSKSKALTYFIKGESEDKISIGKFLQLANRGYEGQVPDAIYRAFRNISAERLIGELLDVARYDLTKELIAKALPSMPPNKETYDMLDLGSNIGLIGIELRNKIDGDFNLTGVEVSDEMIKLQKDCGDIEHYQQVINSNCEAYLEKTNKTFDLILSLNGLNSKSDLLKSFSLIHRALNPDGIFAFTLKTSSSSFFEERNLEFCYNKSSLLKLLQQTKFEIIFERDLTIDRKQNYTIFVCRNF